MLISISNHHYLPSLLVCPSRAVDRRKKNFKCFTIDFFLPFLTCFFTNIGDFLLIYANSTGFRAPPLIEGRGLRYEGLERMWEGTRTIGETRDKGDPAGASPISISRPPNSFFVTTGTFESRRNIWFRRPLPLSLPTTTQAGETCRRNMSFRRLHPSSLMTTATTPVPYTVPSNLRPGNWSNTLPKPPLGLNELSGVRVILGVSTLEVQTGGWFVDVRMEELTLLLCSKLPR